MSTSQTAVMLCGWGVKADMVRVCRWQVKLCDLLANTGHIRRLYYLVNSIIGRYTNVRLLLLFVAKADYRFREKGITTLHFILTPKGHIPARKPNLPRSFFT